MFTGIIEQQGKVTAIETEGNNVHFYVEAPMAKELQVDQSVSHNGVCLTTVDIDKDVYKVTAVDKSFNDTRQEINYEIPDYDTMIRDMLFLINNNKELYRQYKIGC